MSKKTSGNEFDYQHDLEPATRVIEGIFLVMLITGIVGSLIYWRCCA